VHRLLRQTFHGGNKMKLRTMGTAAVSVLAVATFGAVAQEIKKARDTSYMPVDIKEGFASIIKRMKAEKPKNEKRHQDLLTARYDLSTGHRRTRRCSAASPCKRACGRSSKRRHLGGAGGDEPGADPGTECFPGRVQAAAPSPPGGGGMVFPKFHIDEIKKQEGAT